MMKFSEYKKDKSGFRSDIDRLICEHTIKLDTLLESTALSMTVPKGFKLALHLDKENGCVIIVPEDEDESD